VITQLQAVGRWSDAVSKNAVTMPDIDTILSVVAEADIDHAASNAKLVRDAAFRRNGYSSIRSTASLFCDGTKDATDIQRQVLSAVGKIFDDHRSRDPSISSVAQEEKERINSMSDSELPGISCGVAWLDKLTGGFLPTETWVIAAPYKMRKTTLVLNFILCSASHNSPVSVFTVGDSSRDATYRKLLAMVMTQLMLTEDTPQDKAVVSSKTLQYKLRDPYYVALKERACAQLDAYPIRLYDGRDMVGSLSETGRLLRRDAAMFGTKIFVYDYAQAANYGVNDYERTSYLAGWTQQLVGELGVTGIIISQLNEAAIAAGGGDYSPGAKGGGALPAMSNVFLVTRYEEPLLTIELKLARDTRMGSKVTHRLNPTSGLIMDSGTQE